MTDEEMNDKETSDKRKFPRRNIDLTAQIEMVDGSTLACELADLSQGGVRLKVRHPDNLPEQFRIKLSSRLHRWARVAWRSADEVGVEFLAAPQVPAEEAARRTLFIVCPKARKLIPTGVRLTSASDIEKLSPVRRFTQCPRCAAVHGWMPSDATLEADAVPGRPAQGEAASTA